MRTVWGEMGEVLMVFCAGRGVGVWGGWGAGAVMVVAMVFSLRRQQRRPRPTAKNGGIVA